LPGHQVSELPQRVGELVGVTEWVRSSEWSTGTGRLAATGAAASTGAAAAGRLLATGSSGLTRPPLRLRRAEAERTISH
jgi:hypothetical protein